jgi:hypothetical protein
MLGKRSDEVAGYLMLTCFASAAWDSIPENR